MTPSQAQSDHDYWISKALRLEQEARICRLRAQAAKDSAEGHPGRSLERFNTQFKEAAE